jgi:signal transduction histidine kinase
VVKKGEPAWYHVSMRLSPRYRTVLAADLAGGLTTLVMVLPFVHFAYKSAPLHATIETACGLIALLVAFLMLGRYHRTARSDDLAIALALGLFACANFVFTAMPWALLSKESMRFSTWVSLILAVAGGAVFAAASWVPSRRLDHPRRSLHLASAVAIAATAVVVVVVALVHSSLPLGFDPQMAAPPHRITTPVGAQPLVALQFLAAALFMVAALGFTRRGERTGDDLMTWFAASAALASFARVNYGLFPSLYTQWVYVGDALRLASYLLLLIGAAREIQAYQLRLADAAAAEERRRIARELHDGLAQELAFVAAQGRALSRSPDAIDVKYLANAAERALDESRRAIALLTHPPDERLDLALVQTVEELVNRAGRRARFDVEEGIEVPAKTREALLRIVREAVTNASRHGQANTIEVTLENGDGIRLLVADDGIGFDPDEELEGEGFGLTTMRARTHDLGGELRITPRPEGGTEVEVVIP